MKRDLREYEQQTNRRLVIGGILLLFIVGGGLIWWFYGTEAAGLGYTCLLAGLAPIILISLVFLAAEWIIKNARRK
jgi:hypothetical protein